jgi:hypothetical protein
MTIQKRVGTGREMKQTEGHYKLWLSLETRSTTQMVCTHALNKGIFLHRHTRRKAKIARKRAFFNALTLLEENK